MSEFEVRKRNRGQLGFIDKMAKKIIFNKQLYYKLKDLLKEIEGQIFKTRNNIWEANIALNKATKTEAEIKSLKIILKTERVFLVELLDRRKIFEAEVNAEVKKKHK